MIWVLCCVFVVVCRFGVRVVVSSCVCVCFFVVVLSVCVLLFRVGR